MPASSQLSRPALPTVKVDTPAGPIEVDLDADPADGPARLRARGRLLLPDGPMDLELDDLATVDLARASVETDKLRLRRSLRLGQGPHGATRLAPVLLDALEDLLAQPDVLLDHAAAVAGHGVRRIPAPPGRRFERRHADRF